MQQVDSTWRHSSYITTLNTVLATSLEIDQAAQVKASHAMEWPDSGATVEISRSPMMNPSPTSLHSTAIDEPSTPASTATYSTPSVWSSPTEGRESTLTSPATVWTDSSFSSSSQVSPVHEGKWLQCDECDKKFTGSSSDTSLKRHKKSTKAHNNVPKHECHVPGCGVKVRRSDNLKTHLQSVHGFSISKSPQQAELKRRRDDQDEPGRETPMVRNS